MSTEDQTSVPATDDAGPNANPLQRERDDLYDRLLRLTAEFDNYRKRTERERREWSDAAAADVIRDVLPALDDLERALAASAAQAAAAPLRDGVELIRRQLLETLKRRGVEPLDVVGAPFDPEWHEAIASEPANGRPDGEIIEEIRRGYRMGPRLLRPAMVKVTKA
jgi:molecular chaperone GrpE